MASDISLEYLRSSFWDKKSCEKFFKQSDFATIALQLKKEEERIERGYYPSLLVSYLPSPDSRRAVEIAKHLVPAEEAAQLSDSLLRLTYESLHFRLKNMLPGPNVTTSRADLTYALRTSGRSRPSEKELLTTLKVLSHFKDRQLHSKQRAMLAGAEHLLRQALRYEDVPISPSSRDHDWKSKNTPMDALHENEPLEEKVEINGCVPELRNPRHCYICRFWMGESHSLYRSMCPQCGDFNIAQKGLSDPQHLKLTGMTALVTGGRVNLGYHTTLRLLRCGARVIVSSRYPHDAEQRYLSENDNLDWHSRLRIVDADFRTAKDAFDLVDVVRRILQEWDSRLDILINNAAQTLTDSVMAEDLAVRREHLLKGARDGSQPTLLAASSSYAPRIRGVIAPKLIETSAIDRFNADLSTVTTVAHQAQKRLDEEMGLVTTTKSSWLQDLHEIPYEDLISAHSVNTFVPLILVRELASSMGVKNDGQGSGDLRAAANEKPSGYIINVSSREGLLETGPTARAKNGQHVHTNMSKAALNMITVTEAAGYWKKRRVAMNTVDPGFMSAAPEVVAKIGIDGCPIGWEDGAGRLLWPIAIGEREERPIWGRCLKHYGAVEAIVS